MTYTSLATAVDTDVARVTMNRPPVNAVDMTMYGELEDCFASIRDWAPSAKAIVLSGAGRHFCAGNDLDEFATMDPDNGPRRMQRVRRAFSAIRHCPLPVIAAVRGAALGTGLAIAASSDVIIAGTDARFGCPEVGVGVMGAARHLSRLVPPNVVRRMYLTAEPMSALEMERYGGLAAVVEPEQAEVEAMAMARRITRHSRLAVEVAKISLNRIEELPLEGGYRFEQGLTSWLSRFPDAKEALEAVRQRREPAYTDELPAEELGALLRRKDLL